MTPAELDEIAAMLAATTGGVEGDWEAAEETVWTGYDGGDIPIADIPNHVLTDLGEREANAAWIAASKSAARRLLALARECLLLRRIFAADFCADTDVGKDALALAVREGRRQMRAECAAVVESHYGPCDCANRILALPDAPPEPKGGGA